MPSRGGGGRWGGGEEVVTIFLDVTQLKIERIIGVEIKKKKKKKDNLRLRVVSYITVIVVSTVAVLSPL